MHIFFDVQGMKKILVCGLFLVIDGGLSACDREVPKDNPEPPAVEPPRQNVKTIPFPIPMVYREETAFDTVAVDSVESSSDAADSLEIQSSSSAKAKVVAARTPVSSSLVEESSSSEPPPPVYCEGEIPAGMLCDKRDGQMYRLTAIGTQVWMAQNLNYKAEGSWCYANKNENCRVYGRLYTWVSAMALPHKYASESAAGELKAEHQGVCPDGFHMPTQAEMKQLVSYIDKNNKYEKERSGTLLKMKFSWAYSEEWPEGTDRYGFGAMASGFRSAKGDFREMGKDADFWVAEESKAPSHAPYWNLYFDNDEFLGDYSKNKQYAYSVRCLKNKKN